MKAGASGRRRWPIHSQHIPKACNEMRQNHTLFVAEFSPFPRPKVFEFANEITLSHFQKGVETPFVAAFTSHTPIFCNEIQNDPL
jgi:hypothetical protein